MIDCNEKMYQIGRIDALSVQKEASVLTPVQLYEKKPAIPTFQSSRKNLNMLKREKDFVCQSSAGRIVKLIQPYDSDIYSDEPEDLPAQWGFVWGKIAKDALPFISLATSPYEIGDFCTFENSTYKSLIDHNTYSPKEYPSGWEKI